MDDLNRPASFAAFENHSFTQPRKVEKVNLFHQSLLELAEHSLGFSLINEEPTGDIG